VLIDDDNAARICDFGLIRLLNMDERTGVTTTTGHTGTVRYLCYEMLTGDSPPTTASVIYALACLGREVRKCPFTLIATHRCLF
jgi:serine/threonine protein kinase